MKKCITVFLLLVMLSFASSAWADDMTSQIDYSALERYIETWNAAAEAEGIDLYFDSSNSEGYVAFSGSLFSSDPRPVNIMDSLTDETVPANLLMQYLSFTHSIALLYDGSYLTEIPKSIEVYADGQNCSGLVEHYPARNADEMDLYSLEFDMASIAAIFNAEDVFMRLVTEDGTHFQEMNPESMTALYLMWGIMYDGIDYSLKNGENYLDVSLLGQEASEPDDVQTPAVPNVQTLSFQTDYEAIDRAAQSVFLLEVYDENNELTGTGSGFVAFDSGTLITNEHVIDGAAYIIAYSDQYKATYKLLNLKAVDKNKDIAILEFDAAAKVKPLTVDVQSRLLRGQPVTAIGSPKGVLNTVSSGNISNIVYYSEEIPDYIQFTAPISPGSSGGALFGESGEVVGLCVSSLREGEAMYYAIPMKYVEEMYLQSRGKNQISLAQYNALPSELQDVSICSIVQGDGCINLEWTKVSKAENYEIYRRNTRESDFVLVATVQEYGYSDKNVVIGQEYEYYVVAAHSWCAPSVSGTVKITMVQPTPTPTPKPTPVPTPTPIPQGKVLYKLAAVDEEIANIKFRLCELGYYSVDNTFDKRYDLTLKYSVQLFQTHHNLLPTGVVDETTLTTLNSLSAKRGPLNAYNGISEYSKREYRKGETGVEILKLKEKLRILGYYRATSEFDDEYNSTMVDRVKQFQKNNNLNPSGLIDYVTLLKMYGSLSKKGSYYETPPKKSVAIHTEMSGGLSLGMPEGSYAEWQITNNKLKFRLQIENVSSRKSVKSYTLYVYPFDKSGNWLKVNSREYILKGSALQPGEVKFTDYITLEKANEISYIHVAVYEVKYTDGSVEVTPNDRLNQAKWIIQ